MPGKRGTSVSGDGRPIRRSIRLPGYDYSGAGAYYVTICVHRKECLLGEVVSGVMHLNHLGRIADRHWVSLSVRFPSIALDRHCVMPNHLHGTLLLKCSSAARGNQDGAPPLGKVIAYFKYRSTKQINAMRGTPSRRFWQRNYYEHIIRSEEELDRIRKYIVENPLKWDSDPDNPRSRKKPSDEPWAQ